MDELRERFEDINGVKEVGQTIIDHADRIVNIVVCYQVTEPTGGVGTYYKKGGSTQNIVGLMEVAKHDMLNRKVRPDDY